MPRKVLVPGSELHETICKMIRQQWSKAWSDVAALLDSLIVAMEQVFSVDLVRDIFALLVSSPAGLRQTDLLALLGYGYPSNVEEKDDQGSVNPSPQLSPDNSDGGEESSGEEEEEEDGEVAGADATTASVLLQVSGAAFGYFPRTPHLQRASALHALSGAGSRCAEAPAPGGSHGSVQECARGWRERVKGMLRRTSAQESACACVVVSGSAFGGAAHAIDDSDEGAEHVDRQNHAQDSETFVRLLR